MEEPVPSQMKEETTDSLLAGILRALFTFESSVPKNLKKKWQHAYKLLEKSRFQEGAV
jgi:hypothetical protein